MTEQVQTLRIMTTQAYADAFRALNEEWISTLFTLEEKDRVTLGDPQRTIVDPGGQVYVFESDGVVVGCAALIAFGDGVYELSKMAVSPTMRGQGTGRRLLLYVLQQVRGLGARMVFLASSTRLKNAVHLYESVGFHHVAPGRLPELKYARADVFMKMELA